MKNCDDTYDLTSLDLSQIGTPANDVCCKSLSLYMRHVFSITGGTRITGLSLYIILKIGGWTGNNSNRISFVKYNQTRGHYIL